MNWFLEKYPFKNKPFTHQAAYLERFWEEKNAALFAEMGTGKSFMLINNGAMLYDKGKINAMLIVAPKGVYKNWYRSEIPKHMPDHVSYRMAWPGLSAEEKDDGLFLPCVAYPASDLLIQIAASGD
jgi:hypothetical protein